MTDSTNIQIAQPSRACSVWADENGILHNIVHVKRKNTHGMHYFSDDKGKTWTPSPGGGYAFTNHVEYTDGTSEALACRERPHVVQDASGRLIALTNGAARVTCHDAGPAHPQDYSWTLLQPIGGESG